MTDLAAHTLLLVAGLLLLSGDPIITRHDRDDQSFLELGRRYRSVLAHMNLEAPGARPDGEGALIAPRWVLTAAHVATEVEPGHELTVAGDRYAAAAIVVHADSVPPHIDRPFEVRHDLQER